MGHQTGLVQGLLGHLFTANFFDRSTLTPVDICHVSKVEVGAGEVGELGSLGEWPMRN